MSALTVPPPGTWNLPPGLRAAAAARRLTRGWLAACGSGLDGATAGNVVLAVSELAANAAEHGMPPVVLRLHGSGRADAVVVTAEVHDAGTGLPRVFDVELLDERRRGLAIVEAVTDRWGIRDAAGGGKDVWCEVSVPGWGPPSPPAKRARGRPAPERATVAAIRRAPSSGGRRRPAVPVPGTLQVPGSPSGESGSRAAVPGDGPVVPTGRRAVPKPGQVARSVRAEVFSPAGATPGNPPARQRIKPSRTPASGSPGAA